MYCSPKFLVGNVGNCLPFDMVGLYAFSDAYQIYRRSFGQSENVHSARHRFGYGDVRGNHEDDSYYDVGGNETRLYQDCLGKGLKERIVVIRHALRNALIPIVTITGQQLSVVVGGTVIIESIFGLPGMGQLIISSLTSRDYVTFEACLLLYSIVLVVLNLFIDLAYSYLDPRIHYN